jgi:hypothetical protein
MKTTLLSALAFGAITTLALIQPAASTDARSGPVMLTSVQMDKVKAGQPSKEQIRFVAKKRGDFTGQCYKGSGASCN